MKSIGIIFCALWLFVGSLSAQNAVLQTDNRLYAAFEKAHLELLKEKNPLQLLRYNYYLDHAWFLVAIPEGKSAGAEQFPVIRLADPQNANIFLAQEALGLKRHFDRPSYYRVEGTNQILVMRSEQEFVRMFNQERKKYNL